MLQNIITIVGNDVLMKDHTCIYTQENGFYPTAMRHKLCRTIVQVKADLNFQQLKVKFLLKSSVLPQNRVGFGLMLSRRNLTFN